MDDKVKLARQIVSSFPPEQKDAFIKKFGSLKDDVQRQKVIDNVVTKFGSRVKTQEAVPTAPETAMDRREARIGMREDALSKFSADKMLSMNPLEAGGNNLNLVSGLIQRGTAAVVNPMLNQQAGNFNPIDAVKSIGAGLSGKRLGELGDLYVGAGANEPTAATLGFATEAMLTAPKAIAGLVRGATKIPSMVKATGKTISGFNPMFTKAEKATISAIEKNKPFIEKSIGAIKETGKQLKTQLASLKESYKTHMDDLTYTGSKKLEGSIEKSFVTAKENYSRVIDSLKGERVPLTEADQILEDVITKKGIRSKTIQTDAEKELLSLKDKINARFQQKMQLPEGATGVADVNPLLEADELKAFKNIVRRVVKNEPHLEGEFYKNYGEMLQRNGMSELDKATDVYRQAYKMRDEAVALKRSRLNQIASGKIRRGTQEFKDLAAAERPYGLRTTEDVADAYDAFQRERNVLGRSIEGGSEGVKAFTEMLEQAKAQREAIELARNARLGKFKLASAVAGGGAGTGLVSYLLRKK